MEQGIYRWHVSCQRSIGYDLVSTQDLFSPENTALLSVGRIEPGRRFVVVDSEVYRHYSDQISEYFRQNKVEAKIAQFRGGEENKSIESYLFLLKELDAFPICRRDEPIIAIGGGVLTDTVGFVASSYRRGVPHINVPTTLMGYVDASVGVKTGVNFNGSKNRLGAFHPPQRVLLDRAFLKTLPRRHILNGVSEILKLAVIKDAELFRLLEVNGAGSIAANFQDEPGGQILDRSITGMVDELGPNLFEDDLARRMDFGHTFGYGLEARHPSGLLHGEAVLIDIALSTILARSRHLISAEDSGRIFHLIDSLGLRLYMEDLDPDLLWQSLQERTLHRNGSQKIPLPHGIGDCLFVNDVTPAEVRSAVETLGNGMVGTNAAIRQSG